MIKIANIFQMFVPFVEALFPNTIGLLATICADAVDLEIHVTGDTLSPHAECL